MTVAKAEPALTPQGFQGASFSGSEGAFVARSGSGSKIFIVRGNKIWKLDPTQSQSHNNKPWATFE